MRPIDLLVPELFAAEGGIQVYSRNLILALRQRCPQQPLRVFILNDHPHHIPPHGWEGIEWHPARGSRRRLAASLLLAVRRQRPQVLFSTHPNFAPLQLLIQWLTGSPNWCSAHGIEVWNLRWGPRRWALARLQKLLPVSRFTAAQLRQQLGRRCPPLALLPNCVDAVRFSPGPRPGYLLRRYGLSARQPVIVTITRLSRHDRYKHVDRLIGCLPLLLPHWLDLRLLIAGEGELRPELEAQAHALGLEQAVVFTGKVADAELADHLRLATVFALPSEKEGFGIVFLEALCCGCPVLAGNRDGSRDPLGDGRFGLLIDPHLPLAPPLHALLEERGESLWFQPRPLAAAVARQFGFEAFGARLAAELDTLEQP
jgi:glycosyltransferase involved in cell wall biosynthesis